jgi:DNA ligase D-like protein (predicted 3'-phosphoesterase)
MALEEYRAKRDFTRTPEPQGGPSRKAGKVLYFCVQKHLASHLHYDLRLEHDGVLLSWAVPKGPSLDPKTKRLATRVEEHPLEYGEFEGVIPEGYGAGVVMLWDTGSWQPQPEDVGEALQKGELKFSLEGYKLKGSWVLVRTGGRDSRNWLLIKHRDEWAGDVDVAELAPLSVKSGGDFDDILTAEAPEAWQSHKCGETSLADSLTRIVQRVAAYKERQEERKPRVGETVPVAGKSERAVKRARTASGGRQTGTAAKPSVSNKRSGKTAAGRRPGKQSPSKVKKR